MSYDGLAARRQRQEAAGAKPWPFHFGEDHFEFPAEVPAELLPLLGQLAEFIDGAAQDGKQDGAVPKELVLALPSMLEHLLGKQDAQRLAAHRLSIQDVGDLLMTYFEESFGGGVGESAGSPGSSPGEPKTPKPTSARATKSTSRTTTARRKR
jgi:hypothetical protein